MKGLLLDRFAIKRQMVTLPLGAAVLAISALSLLLPAKCAASPKTVSEIWLDHEADRFKRTDPDNGQADDVARRLGQLEQRIAICFVTDNFDKERQARAEYAALLAKVFGEDDWHAVTQRLYHASAERILKLTPDQQALIARAREFSNDGERLKGRRNYPAALSSFRDALRLYQQVLGEDDVWSIATLAHIAQTEQRSANYKEMKTIWTESAPRIKVLYGEKSPCYAQAVQTLGIANLGLGKHDEAEGQLRQALEIYRAVFGAESLEAVSSHYFLADSYNQRSQFSKAESEAKLAEAVLSRTLPEKYPEYVLALWQLAKSYRSQGKHTDAVAVSARAVGLIETFGRPPAAPVYADILEDYAVALRKLNRGEEAAKFAARAKSLRSERAQKPVTQK